MRRAGVDYYFVGNAGGGEVGVQLVGHSSGHALVGAAVEAEDGDAGVDRKVEDGRIGAGKLTREAAVEGYCAAQGQGLGGEEQGERAAKAEADSEEGWEPDSEASAAWACR